MIAAAEIFSAARFHSTEQKADKRRMISVSSYRGSLCRAEPRLCYLRRLFLSESEVTKWLQRASKVARSSSIQSAKHCRRYEAVITSCSVLRWIER